MSNKIVIYIHGKGGSAEEATHYRTLFPECDAIGFEYKAQTPWEAVEEFPKLFDVACEKYKSVVLVANSIGAYFAMNALVDRPIEKAYFISPVVDMPKLIMDMMTWANVTEDELRGKGEIKTAFGETLSWDYLCYAREHPVCWTVPTRILYGEKDHLTSLQIMSAFAERVGAALTVMPGGEHWFHTEEQMAFLNRWIKQQSLEGREQEHIFTSKNIAPTK